MRINDMNYGFYNYKNQQTHSNTASTSKKTSPSADIQISARGREISEAMKSDKPQNQARIEELKQQIASGTYSVDSVKVAGKLLDFWRQG